LKSLLNAADREAILARLDRLGPDAERRWGRMSVGGMLCHLDDAFLAVLGERPADRSPRLFERTVLRWIAVSTPVPWPKGVQTTEACDQERGGTQPTDFATDRARLGQDALRFVSAIDSDRLSHSIFGKMSAAEWGRWGYRHMDHHLRQFSA